MTTSRDLYDTKEGIAGCLASLSGMHALIDARVDAGYRRNERLNQFVLFGRWALDSCGNIGRMIPGSISFVPKDRFPDIPDVMTHEEFRAFIAKHAPGEQMGITTVMSGPAIIAPWDVPCSVCGRKWSLADAYDIHIEPKDRTERLTDWVGKPFEEFKQSLRARKDAHHWVAGELEIRNDRFIDLSPHPSGREGWVVNETGWVGRNGEIGPDYVVQEGDEAAVHSRYFLHTACHASVMAARREWEFRLMFLLAGFDYFTLDAVSNRYGEAEYGGPWFEVSTSVGRILIGWRRRVINIDWSATGQHLLYLFDDVDDTKDHTYIHAWRPEQVIDYLRRIREELSKEPASAAS